MGGLFGGERWAGGLALGGAGFAGLGGGWGVVVGGLALVLY